MRCLESPLGSKVAQGALQGLVWADINQSGEVEMESEGSDMNDSAIEMNSSGIEMNSSTIDMSM